ncbi:MAG: hypothetical protein JNG86_00390 [Verrucomicrobiaceae bacterium]|nr:hypothetical protein [Verrucomicrobiaceae bacterium]
MSSNHSRPIAATINTTMMLHGIDEVDSSFGVDVVGLNSGAFVVGGSTTGSALGVDAGCGGLSPPECLPIYSSICSSRVVVGDLWLIALPDELISWMTLNATSQTLN